MEDNAKNANFDVGSARVGSEAPGRVSDASSASSKNKKGGKSFLVVLIIIIVLCGVAGGAWYLLKEPSVPETNGTSTSDLQAPGSNLPTNTPAPSPTPEEINREEISIKVLNGTGISGEAGLLKEKLEDLGYTEIETANASTKDNETTTVTFASGISASIIDEITKELEGTYKDVNAKKSSSLDENNIEIVTGLRKGQSLPTAAPAPTKTPTAAPTGSVTPTVTPSPTPAS